MDNKPHDVDLGDALGAIFGTPTVVPGVGEAYLVKRNFQPVSNPPTPLKTDRAPGSMGEVDPGPEK